MSLKYNMGEQKHLDQELITAWIKGSQQAFGELYDELVDQIYRFIFFKVNTNDAEDLVELTFLKAWEKRSLFDASKSNFKTWLFTIARNCVIDYYRSCRQTADIEVVANVADSKQESPKHVVERELNKDSLRLALEYLKEPYKEIVVLRYLEDFSYGEIAELLDRTESAIRVMNFRGLKKLKQVLKDLNLTL